MLLGVWESVGECEGMNPHTPKCSSHFGNWSPDGFLTLHKVIARVKTDWIE